MSTQLQQVNMNSRNHIKKSHFRTGNIVLAILFFMSVLLTIWGIYIYRLTVIDQKYLLVVVLAGIITAVALLSFLVKCSYSPFWGLFIKAVVGGGIFYFCFLFLNQRFADKNLLSEQFLITEKGTLPGKPGGCRIPYIVIDFYGADKELIFYCQDANSIRHASKVNLNYSKGLFGVEVIKSIQVLP